MSANANRLVLLRLANTGAPRRDDGVSNGVLILPSIPLPDNFKQNETPLFHLSFQLDASALVTRNATFYTNLPQGPADDFDRLAFQSHAIALSFDTDITITLPIYRPGSYCYYINYASPHPHPHLDNEKVNSTQTDTEKFYFNVPPNLLIGGKYLPFNSINIQSVVSKWIGSNVDKDWNALFQRVSDRGYNMVHFTPLQQRGSSNSPYSIFDQLKFDPEIFAQNDPESVDKVIHDVLVKKHGLLTLTDVVWNHTANNSAWLREHPSSGYSAETAPHLIPAMELDAKLLEFSGQLKALGLPTKLQSDLDLSRINEAISSHVVAPLNLWQFYVFDRTAVLKDLKCTFDNCTSAIEPTHIPSTLDVSSSKQVADFAVETCSVDKRIVFGGDRYSNRIEPHRLLALIAALLHTSQPLWEDSERKAASIVDAINVDLYAEYDRDVATIKSQISNRIRFQRLDAHGPLLGEVTAKAPLTEPYFTRFTATDGNDHALANNGWIWGGNPLVDFALSSSKAYLRREVIIWGDCVKLRYGKGVEDSPYLWSRMIEYTRICAKVFGGFRIDNCHSTPLHVGERLLDEARKVNPNLYVVAELFSGSEEMDKIFVERLGINTLIREAMQAWNVSELSRLVHKHGGRPIGSFTWMPLDDFAYPASTEPSAIEYCDSDIKTHSEIAIPKNLSSQQPHALFMDCTHDNEVPSQKRTVEDTLPNAALVAFCSAAIGSVFGYDDCYPELLDVVGEKRQYNYSEDSGIGPVKTKLHKIRQQLAEESQDAVNDSEMYIHHEEQYITIQRHNARTGTGWFLVARTKFTNSEAPQTLTPPVLSGTNVKAEFSYTLEKTGEYERDSEKLTGIPTKLVEIEVPRVEGSAESESKIFVDQSKFPPGSIAVFSTLIPQANLSLDNSVKKGAIEASLDLDLYDLNAILYKCEAEERDASAGSDGTYTIPTSGEHLVYAGLEGWILVLKRIIWENNLGHPLCNHLREGEWAFDYVVNRLDKYAAKSKGVKKFQDWLRSRIDSVRGTVPYFLRPHYFTLIVGIAYEAARFRCLRLMSPRIQSSNNFVQSLALTSVQMCGDMNNTSLKAKEQVPCVAAGLPHFSNDYMRCWGRDVFISFRGLFLVVGREDDAKRHILGFAQTLKHGLIPNLLDAGRNPRYNARDAAWFFAQAVQEYVLNVKDGVKILDEEVDRRFPLDDEYVTVDDPKAFSYKTSIRDVLYEILSRHAAGIKYREANAGPNLDSQMKDEGFNVEVDVDWETGFIHGGSQFNCGTWMDKMGESERAGSKGVPGTPRDGANVELIGLLKSTLRWVNELHTQGHFQYTEVTKNDGSKISLKEWESLIQDNFEKCFYVPKDPSHDGEYSLDSSLINRRGIYKDIYKSGKPFEDYQLRPNFAIAMTASPELFKLEHAIGALELADKVIRGPLGMRTLDPSDYNYRPNYHNNEDTTDFATSKGRNYHQGPEWVWCIGYFFRAYLHFYLKQHKEDGIAEHGILNALQERLQAHHKWIRESPWAGLTELTNQDGALCQDSSPTQAWSGSCLLDLYYDVWNHEK